MEVDVSKLMKEVEDYENRYENKYVGSLAAMRIAAALLEPSMEAVLISLKQIEHLNQHLNQLNTNRRK